MHTFLSQLTGFHIIPYFPFTVQWRPNGTSSICHSRYMYLVIVSISPCTLYIGYPHPHRLRASQYSQLYTSHHFPLHSTLEAPPEHRPYTIHSTVIIGINPDSLYPPHWVSTLRASHHSQLYTLHTTGPLHLIQSSI